MKLCLHIHSEYSHDSKSSVKEIVNTAKKLGYNVIAITDHNTAKGGVEALKYQDNGIKIIPGAEFSTQYGHVLAYFIDETIEKNTPKIDNKRFDFYKIVENVKKSNGVLILAHPYNSKLKDNMDILNHVDGIEKYNARLDSFYFKTKSNNFTDSLLNKKNFIYLGGPDAHSLEELKNCYTITEDFDLNPKDFKSALIKKSIIYYKKSSNYIIAKAKLHNLKKFKFKIIIKNIIRMIFGIYEIFYNKITRSKEYETICISKKS
ncbi:PHP domain-containing protein [Defluviitalea phaphyphila]|uniref:PHP domain-containing protein n=1 Tax=Defluviitalea phaphyphila TaxID=1473580 RepID=UPI000731E290|nr:PHP domain-containing protein [Defluviitalea phaphyphila]